MRHLVRIAGLPARKELASSTLRRNVSRLSTIDHSESDAVATISKISKEELHVDDSLRDIPRRIVLTSISTISMLAAEKDVM